VSRLPCRIRLFGKCYGEKYLDVTGVGEEKKKHLGERGEVCLVGGLVVSPSAVLLACRPAFFVLISGVKMVPAGVNVVPYLYVLS